MGRLLGLQKIQEQLGNTRPPNYGTLTAVVTHLLRHTIVTPPVKTQFLKNSLEQIRFQEIRSRFGIFFLHGLRIERGILEEVSSEDGQEVINFYGKSLIRRQHVAKESTATHLARHNKHTDDAYPWSTHISWKTLKSLLANFPREFLRPSPLNLTRQPSYHLSGVLFCTFTTDIWLLVSESYATRRSLPQPHSLEEAIKAWSITSVKELLNERCLFVPGYKNPQCLSKLSSAPSFSSSVMSTFFPPAESIHGHSFSEKSLWAQLLARGYLHDYVDYFKQWDRKDFEVLRDDLDWIFNHIQCLPDTGLYSKQVWRATYGRLQFVTNPAFYRAQWIDYKARGLQHARPQVSMAIARQRLRPQGQGKTSQENTKRDKRRGAKATRSRKPPVRRQPDALIAGASSKSSKFSTIIPLQSMKTVKARHRKDSGNLGSGSDGSEESEDDNQTAGSSEENSDDDLY